MGSNYGAVPADTEKDDGDIYVKFSLSKYPFLKNVKVGSSGTATFKAEITSSHVKDGHEVTFNDLTNKRESARMK